MQPSIRPGPWTRRDFLKLAGTYAACGGLGGLGALARPAEAQPSPVHLNFMVWSFGLETIRDKIKSFRQGIPAITVTFKKRWWLIYQNALATSLGPGKAP